MNLDDIDPWKLQIMLTNPQSQEELEVAKMFQSLIYLRDEGFISSVTGPDGIEKYYATEGFRS